MAASAPAAWKQAITASRATNLASNGTQLGTGIASFTSLMRAPRSFHTSSPAKNSTMMISSQLKAPCRAMIICEVTGQMEVPYSVCRNSADGRKLARPSTSSTMKGTLRSTPRVSNRTWRRNCRHAVPALNTGVTRGSVVVAGRSGAGSADATALPRPQRRRPLPLRSVRNRAKVAANSAAATVSHSTRLASR
ncbi:hypothetical protein D3C81_750720 [compost metagenome]